MTRNDGPEHRDRHCGARTRSGSPCRRPAGWGTNHAGYGACKLHGGSTPNGIKAARRRKAAEAVAVLGLPTDVDPHIALLDEVHRTAGHVSWLGEKIREDGESALVQTVYTKGGTHEAPSVWVELYQQERAHLVKVAKAAIDAGVEERRVRLAEEQGRALVDVLRAIFDDPELGLTTEQREAANRAAGRHLRAVSALSEGGQR